jgi:hypothetical protein
LTSDAQEKSARSYELEFAPNEKYVNSKFWAHFGWPFTSSDILMYTWRNRLFIWFSS